MQSVGWTSVFGFYPMELLFLISLIKLMRIADDWGDGDPSVLRL
jgi:hypothetical protein